MGKHPLSLPRAVADYADANIHGTPRDRKCGMCATAVALPAAPIGVHDSPLGRTAASLIEPRRSLPKPC